MSRMNSLNTLDLPAQTLVDWPTLRFMLRRHQTQQLQWDLTVEANGVQYTWRMYQLPSVNPLRVISVCLHGLAKSQDMLGQGSLSDDQHGAGLTLAEDFGWLMPTGVSSQSQAQDFQEQFRKGKIELWIEGDRLKGGFVLEGRGDRWRIRKLADEFATTVEPEWTCTSALNGPHAW